MAQTLSRLHQLQEQCTKDIHGKSILTRKSEPSLNEIRKAYLQLYIKNNVINFPNSNITTALLN